MVHATDGRGYKFGSTSGAEEGQILKGENSPLEEKGATSMDRFDSDRRMNVNSKEKVSTTGATPSA